MSDIKEIKILVNNVNEFKVIEDFLFNIGYTWYGTDARVGAYFLVYPLVIYSFKYNNKITNHMNIDTYLYRNRKKYNNLIDCNGFIRKYKLERLENG